MGTCIGHVCERRVGILCTASFLCCSQALQDSACMVFSPQPRDRPKCFTSSLLTSMLSSRYDLT
jgi:hypothetical protein